MKDDVLRQLQLCELEILKSVDAVCQKHGLQYFLVGGTLLGAVRHQGFIPWDDDLDIAMPRKDFNRFVDLCSDGVLGNDYFFQYINSEKNYWLPFAKVRKNNTLFDEKTNQNITGVHKGIFLDIFPLDKCSQKSGILYHLKAKMVKKFNYIIVNRVLQHRKNDIQTKILIAISKLFSIKQLSLFRDRLATSSKTGDYYINYGSNYKYTKQTMPISVYEPAVRIKFEDGEFCAPHDYEQYLVNLFRDWKKLPPEEERRNHNPVKVVFDTSVKE